MSIFYVTEPMVGAVDLSFIHDLTVHTTSAEAASKPVWICDVLKVGAKSINVPSLQFVGHTLKWNLSTLTGIRRSAVKSQLEQNGSITIRVTYDTNLYDDLTIGLTGVQPAIAAANQGAVTALAHSVAGEAAGPQPELTD